MKFYGRQREAEILRRCQEAVLKGASCFTVVTGRRRVGKTRLISETLPREGMPFVYVFVAQTKSAEQNLQEFAQAVAEAFNLDAPPQLHSFEQALDFVFKRAKTQPVTLVLDEFQNFQTVESTFFESLQKLWDLNQNKMQLLLVTSGSVTSAMRQIFEDGQAPLFARQNTMLWLQPFVPAMVKRIFSDFSPDYTGEELLTLYELTGGVANHMQVMLEQKLATKTEEMIARLFESSDRTFSDASAALIAEFKGNLSVYFDILRLIAGGVTARSELQSKFKTDISGYLQRLELVYRLIERVEPLGNNGSQRQRIRFELTDELVNFWFRFVEPRQRYMETGWNERVYQACLKEFPTWSGRCLERFYRRHFASCGLFTDVAPWWDKKGDNEIDLIAADDLDKKIVFAEVKRNPDKINLEALKEKALAFMTLNPKYKNYEASFMGLSLKELAAKVKLPFE